MTAAQWAVHVLLYTGVAVTVLSCVGALCVGNVYTRLHFLSPITSLAAPLIGLALAIDIGWGLTTGEILFIVFLLAITGPQLEAAAGRVAAQSEGLVRQESPE